MSDTTSTSSGNDLLLTRLAEEFAARFRAGERPSLQEYIDRHPELADDIRDLLPAMVEIERVKEDHQEAAGQEAAAPAPPALERLGDFRILREVGQGGMGIVYEAEQVSLGRHVALKVLPRNMLLDARARRRFEREAKSAARLHHTNIVPVFGVGEQDGLPYYVMQFIHGLGLDAVLEELKRLQHGPAGTGTNIGGGLRVSRDGGPVSDRPDGELTAAHVARSLLTGGFEPASDGQTAGDADGGRTLAVIDEGPAETAGTAPRTHADGPSPSDSFAPSSSSVVLPARGRDGSRSGRRRPSYWQSVASIGAQAAEALDYAHDHGVLHRDIKPSNLLLDTQGTVWVADFGLAKADDQQNLTDTGDILGTLRYMPPEAFEGKADACGDVYSLGLTLYEMLAFRPAFDEKERNRLIKQVTHAEPPRLGKLNRAVPRDLETIVHKAIDREPGRRYPRAADLAADLHRFLDDEPIQARRASATERLARWCRRNPAVAMLTGVVAFLLVVATGILAVSVVRISAARDDEASQRRRAEDSAEESRQRLVLANVAGGANLVDQGDLHSALPWFAEALRLDQGDPAREENHRLRLAATLERSPKLVALWSTEAGPGRAVFCPDGRRVAVSGSGGMGIWDADSGRLTLSVAKDSAVTDFAFSPDGKRVATAGQDGTARVWNLETGQPTTPPLAHRGPVNRVVFREDGRLLATASDDQTARLWDAVTGEQLQSLSPGGAVHSASFSPDGQRLVTRSGGTITVWEAASGKRVQQFFADVVGDHEAAFTADGRHIIVTGGQRIVRTWDAETGTLLSQIPQGGAAWLSLDRRRAVSGIDVGLSQEDIPAQVWDVPTGQPVTPPLEETRGTVNGTFSPQGDRLLTTGADGTVRVWAVETAEVVAGPLRHDAAVTSAAFSPDGRLLVTREASGLVHVWDLAGSAAPSSPLKTSIINGYPQFSTGGRWLVARAPGGYFWLWDTRTGRLIRTVNEASWAVSAAVSPDGSRFLGGYGSGMARIREAATGRPVGEPLRHRGSVIRVEFSPDGRTVATAGEDQTACVWDAATGKRICEIKHTFAVRWAAFSPDGRHLVTTTGDFPGGVTRYSTEPWTRVNHQPAGMGDARVWDALTGRPVTPLIHHEGVVQRASFSPDGRFLLTTCIIRTRTADAYQVRVWDAAGGQPVTPPLVHPQGVLHETFSPDGRLVATGCFDGAARIWDVATGKALPFVAKHNSAVAHVAFSADSRRLLTAGNDGAARVWDAASGQAIAVLRHPRGLAYAVFAPDGHSVFTGCIDLSVRVWPLTPDRRPVADWVAMADVKAGGENDSSRGRNPEEDWTATWRKLREKYPADFATTKEEQLAWHRSALEIALRKKAWSAALQHLTRLTEIDPASWQDRLARARLLARLERWDEAEAEFTQAIERHPEIPEVWVARGSYFLGRGRRDRAEADLARAIDLGASSELPAALSEFWVAGLYPEAFGASCPPEAQLDPSRPIPGMSDEKSALPILPRWRGEATEASGYLDLAACFDGAEQSSAYALAYVYSKVEREVVLLTGSDDGLRLWLNGRPIYDFLGGRAPAPDQDRVLAKLRRGWNTVLARVANDTGQHGLFLRISADPRELAEARVRPFALTLHDAARATLDRDVDVHRVDVTEVDGHVWHVQITRDLHDLEEAASYTVRFRARADVPRQVQLYAQIREGDWHCIGLDVAVPLTAEWKEYSYQFLAQDLDVGNLIAFNVGERTGTVWIADVTVTKVTDADLNAPENQERLRRHRLMLAAPRGAQEGLPLLAKAAADDPKDTVLSLRLAALQAWFGQEKELAATRQQIRAHARDTGEPTTAERAAKACSIAPSTSKAELDSTLALARRGVELDADGSIRGWAHLALGMAEYRSGHDAASIEALLAAERAGPSNRKVTGIAAFYRAMSLSHQGKQDEARRLALAAAAAMKPLPKDQQNPLADGADHDDLILWLAYKEAMAMIRFDEAPPSGEPKGRK